MTDRHRTLGATRLAALSSGALLLALPGAAAASSVSITATAGQLTYTGDSGPNAVTIAWGGTPAPATSPRSIPWSTS